MSTFNGLPIHPMLVHFIVVLAPLTAILAILCAFWPAARRRLVWLVLVLAGITAAVTPVATEAGEWLEHHLEKSELVEKHAEMGDTMVYFALALLVAAVLLVVGHVRAERDKPLTAALSGVIAAFVLLAGIATTVQVFRIGHSGAEATWGDALTEQPAGTAAADDDGK